MNKLFFLLALCGAAYGQQKANIPTFSFREVTYALGHNHVGQDLKTAISEVGAFALKDIPESAAYHDALAALRRDAPECLTTTQKKVVKTELAAGERLTSATMSETADDAHPECVETAEIELAFDRAATMVKAAVKTLLGEDTMPTYVAGGNVVDITRAPHLDHLHVYKQHGDARMLAPYHQDNGLFLLLTPYPEQPLEVQAANGEALLAAEGDVIVLFGRAMNEWLLEEKTDAQKMFRAAPHAVRAPAGKAADRVVYARMYVAPMMATATHDR